MEKTWQIILPTLVLFLFNCMKAERISTDSSGPEGFVLNGFSLGVIGSSSSSAGTGRVARFVAVGESCSVWASVDGTSWSNASTLPGCTSANISSVVYGNGIWVITGPDSGASGCGIWSSDDGYAWTKRTCPVSDTTPKQSLAFGNGIFLAGGSCNANSQMLATSTNGIDWTGALPCNPLNVERVSSIVFDQSNHFLASVYLSATTPPTHVYAGTDQSLSDTATPLATSQTFFPGATGYADTFTRTLSGVQNYTVTPYSFSGAGTALSVLSTSSSSAYVNSFTYGSGKHIAVGTTGSSGCETYYYTNQWYTGTGSGECVNFYFTYVTAGSGKFVAAGTTNDLSHLAVFETSSDGITWTPGTITTSASTVSAIAAAP